MDGAQPLAPAALEPQLRDGRIKPGSARVATPPSEAAYTVVKSRGQAPAVSVAHASMNAVSRPK